VVISVDVWLQLSDTQHMVELLRISDEFVTETCTWQHNTHNRKTSKPQP